MRVSIEDGKYEYVLHEDGRSEVLRYGESWRDCVGDKFTYCMAAEIESLRQQLAEKSAESDRRLDLMNTLDAENESLRKQLKLCAAGELREAGFENGFEGIPLVEVVRDGVLDIY